jgi:hypothetical protein
VRSYRFRYQLLPSAPSELGVPPSPQETQP